MRPSDGNLYLDGVAQQLVGAEVGLIEREAGRVRRRFELLQGGGDVCVGVAPRFQVVAQQIGFDGAIVCAFAPIAEVAISEAVVAGLVGEEGDDPVLRDSFGPRAFGHCVASFKRSGDQINFTNAATNFRRCSCSAFPKLVNGVNGNL